MGDLVHFGLAHTLAREKDFALADTRYNRLIVRVVDDIIGAHRSGLSVLVLISSAATGYTDNAAIAKTEAKRDRMKHPLLIWN